MSSLAVAAHISSVFFMTICVGNPTPLRTREREKEIGREIYSEYAEGEGVTPQGLQADEKTREHFKPIQDSLG